MKVADVEGRFMYFSISLARTIIRTVWGDHKRCIDTYFSQLMKGNILQAMDARRDKDGFYRITGRVDDVMNSFRT